MNENNNLEKPSTQSTKKSNWITRFFLGLGLVIAKGKTLLISLFKIKGVATFLSFIISVFTYWWAWHLGFWGALGFVLLILVHEMGHVLMLNRLGFPATAPMFIPFLGAVIGLKAVPNNAKDEALFAFGGPALGTVGAFFCLIIYWVTASHLFLWLATTGFLINLFNLIPVSPFDGGRIIGVVWRGFWFIGLVMLAALALATRSEVLLLFAAIALFEVEKRFRRISSYIWALLAIAGVILTLAWKDQFYLVITIFCSIVLGIRYWSNSSKKAQKQLVQADSNPIYFSVPPRTRVAFGLAYFSLVSLLSGLIYYTFLLTASAK